MGLNLLLLLPVIGPASVESGWLLIAPVQVVVNRMMRTDATVDSGPFAD